MTRRGKFIGAVFGAALAVGVPAGAASASESCVIGDPTAPDVCIGYEETVSGSTPRATATYTVTAAGQDVAGISWECWGPGPWGHRGTTFGAYLLGDEVTTISPGVGIPTFYGEIWLAPYMCPYVP